MSSECLPVQVSPERSSRHHYQLTSQDIPGTFIWLSHTPDRGETCLDPRDQISRNDPSRERYYSDWNWISPSLVVVVDVCLWLSICAPLGGTSLTWHNGNPDWADPSHSYKWAGGRGQYKHTATRVVLGSTGVTPSNQRVKYTCHNHHQ